MEGGFIGASFSAPPEPGGMNQKNVIRRECKSKTRKSDKGGKKYGWKRHPHLA